MYKCTISPSSTADYSRLMTFPQNRYVFRGVSPFRWNSSGLRTCVYCWRTEWEELVGASLAWDAGFQLSCLVTLLCRFRMIPEGSHDGKTIALYHVGLVGRSIFISGCFLGLSVMHPCYQVAIVAWMREVKDSIRQGLLMFHDFFPSITYSILFKHNI